MQWPSAAHLHQLKAQDPCEGPSLVGRTTRGFLGHGLVRLAREEVERSRQGTSRGAHDVSHEDQGRQAGASPHSVFLSSLVQRRASVGESIKQRHPFRCNKTKTSRAAGRRSPWSPRRRHHESFWQPKTTFGQDNLYYMFPFKMANCWHPSCSIISGRGPGPL